MSKEYKLWVTSLFVEEEKIVMCLVRNGFRVEPLGDNDILSDQNDCYVGALTAIRIGIDSINKHKDLSTSQLSSFLEKEFNDLGIKYFSLVLQSITDDLSSWRLGNISVSELNWAETNSPYKNKPIKK